MYIKQQDGASWSGCYVQVPGFPGKLFSYASYGRDRALALAIKHRNALLPKLRKRVTPKIVAVRGGCFVKSGAQANSSTGILGVHLIERKVRRNKRIVWRRIALATCRMPDGKVMRRQFSVARLGEELALRSAAKARADMVMMKLQR